MESIQEIPNLNLLILIAAGVAVGLILFKVAQKALRLILVLAVAGLAVFFWQGGTVDELKQEGVDLFFKESTLDQMLAVNCPENKEEKAKCDCVVIPVQQELENRLTEAEKEEVNGDWELMKREIRLAMKGNREIRSCLLNNHGKKYLDKLGDLVEGLKNESQPIPED